MGEATGREIKLSLKISEHVRFSLEYTCPTLFKLSNLSSSFSWGGRAIKGGQWIYPCNVISIASSKGPVKGTFIKPFHEQFILSQMMFTF